MSQEKLMKCLYFASITLLVLSYCTTYATERKTSEVISAGMNLPEIMLVAPDSEKDREYLCLKDPNPFSLTQVSAKVIVLEIFNVYCKHCRMQAPKLNKVYKLIQQNMELSPDIKMIGIAVVSDQKKTDKWKSILNVPFPLFADSKADIWKKLGKPGFPLTLLITNRGKILSVHSGVTEDTDELFSHIKKIHSQQ